jgi:hypothetical protein
MLIPGPSLLPDEVQRRIHSGKSLGGTDVNCARLLETISQINSPSAPIVRDAILSGPTTCNASFAIPVRFLNCVFLDNMEFRDAIFHSQLTFRDCDFRRQLDFHNCSFHEPYSFSKSVCRDRVRYWANSFLAPPRLARINFQSDLLLLLGAPEPLSRFQIHQCRFGALVQAELPPGLQSLEFSECEFTDIATCSLVTGENLAELRLLGCTVRGKLVIRYEATSQKQDSAVRPALDLSGSTCSGMIHLRGQRLRWLNLGSTFLPGTFAANREDILLLRHQVLLGQEDRPMDWNDLSAVEDRQLAAQEYEELRNSFARTPRTHTQQDHCHYWMMELLRQADVCQLGAALEKCCEQTPRLNAILKSLLYRFESEERITNKVTRDAALARLGESVFCLTIVLVISLFAIFLCCLIALPSGWGLAAWALLPICYAIVAARNRCVFEFGRSFWSWAVLKEMLGYGVLAHRVFATAAGMIVLFAIIYGLMTAYFPSHGMIVYSAGAEELPINMHAKEVPIGFPHFAWRCLYYSTVTFTTLGYGDFRPLWRLNIVASIEACVGAVMIALLTVIFARRFLRM